MGFLHLSENLRLADYERIEPRCDAEQVPGGFEVGDVVDVREHGGPVDAVVFADEVGDGGAASLHVVARGVQLGAVARGDDDRLARDIAVLQRLQGVVDAARLEVEALAQLDGRRTVADAN